MKIRTLAVSLLSTLPLLSPAAGQVVETIDVRVVNVDVTVTDRRGRPVSGLTRESFEVLEDGIPQEVTHFYVVEKTMARAAGSQSATATAVPDAERFRRKVLVLVDDMNMSAARRSKALRDLETFVDQSGEEIDWSVVTVDRRPHLILPLTSDKTKVRAALAAVRTLQKNDAALSNDAFSSLVDPAPYATPALAFRLDTGEGLGCFASSANTTLKAQFTRGSLDAMLSAVRGFANVEGKKALFVVTGNLPLEPIGVCDNRYIVARDEENKTRADIRNVLAREANASNTSVYILGVDNLQAQDITGHSPTPPPPDNSSAMYWLAANTGGRLMNDASLRRSLDEFDQATGTFYSLGYQPKHSDDQRYHRVAVRLKNRQRYRLAYRNGYSDVATEQQLERSMRSLIGIAMQKATIPMALAPSKVTADGETMIVPLSASLPMKNVQLIKDAGGVRGQIDLYLSVFDELGANIGVAKASHEIRIEENDPRNGRIIVNFKPFRLPKGAYTFAAAVRDRLSDELGVAVQKFRF